MKLYITFTRKTLAALAAAILLCVLIAGRFSSVSAGDNLPSGATNALRAEFARSLGYELDEETAVSKTITVPLKFSDVYERYNELQNQAGFDLKPYAGCEVTVYTYAVKDSSDGLMMNIIVCDGVIIGGDVCTASIDGYMLPLCRK